MDYSERNDTGKEPDFIQLRPVGIVRNQSNEPSWGESLGVLDWRDRADRMKQQRDSVSEIIIDSTLEGILDGIGDFSHIMVLYWAHLVPSENRSITRVHPMGNKEFPLVGVFTTQSPVRPNSILTTVVRLKELRGNTLMVTGLDALDGSPVLDIKPYVPDHEQNEDVRLPAWMSHINKKFNKADNPPSKDEASEV